ncbi:unnamed protein product, partial [Rotaria magnacalcarata]
FFFSIDSVYCYSASVESTSLPTVTSIVWDDDDDDLEQLLTQFPAELPSEKPFVDNDSIIMNTPSTDDDNTTCLDATRRSSAMLTSENQSLIHNSTKIELSSQPNYPQNRLSTSTLQRSYTGPISPAISKNTIRVNSPRVRCDSASAEKKKITCTEAEIEQKRLAALAKRRQREQERQQQQQQKKR